MKSAFVFFLLVALAIAAPLDDVSSFTVSVAEDKIAVPSTEEVATVAAPAQESEELPVAVIEQSSDEEEVEKKAPVVDPAPIVKPKSRVPILASRFREKALGVVSAPIPERKIKVSGAAGVRGSLRPKVKTALRVPVVEVAVAAPVKEAVATDAVVAVPVTEQKVKIAAAAAVNAALKPKLTAVVSAPVIEKEPEVEVAVAAPVEEVKVVALSAPVQEAEVVALAAPVQEAEVVAVVPVSEKKVKVSVASAAEKPRLKSKAKAGGRRKKVQTYVAPVALDENGQPIDPRANDPVTLVKAYSDYNIFERTYDYGFESVDGIKIVAEGAAQHKKEDEEDGTVARGSYSYPGVDGRLVVVNWVADSKGYRASASNVLPPANGEE